MTGAELLAAYARGERAFVGANLGGANLRGANLWDVNLGGANLRGANLWGANLWSANLGGANLGGANLGSANLRGAKLRGANLRGANLRYADLGGANLRGAKLPYPDTSFQRALSRLGACHEARLWVASRTLRTAWRECKRDDWREWLCTACSHVGPGCPRLPKSRGTL
jgi:uncharacterized protein YjbI with pentapeptide repeats